MNSIGIIIVASLLGILAVVCLHVAYNQKKETGFIYTNAWLWASAEKRANMDDRIKKAEYRVGRNVFFLIAILFLLLSARIIFSLTWLIHAVHAIIIILVIYAIFSSVQTSRLERSIIPKENITLPNSSTEETEQ